MKALALFYLLFVSISASAASGQVVPAKFECIFTQPMVPKTAKNVILTSEGGKSAGYLYEGVAFEVRLFRFEKMEDRVILGMEFSKSGPYFEAAGKNEVYITGINGSGKSQVLVVGDCKLLKIEEGAAK